MREVVFFVLVSSGVCVGSGEVEVRCSLEELK